MAIRTVSKGLTGAALIIGIVVLLAIAQAPAAQAAQPILKLTVDHSLRLADGYSTAVVTATLTNNAVPVANAQINFTTNYSGSFSLTTDSNGNASTTVGPFPSTSYYMANISANSSNINVAASTLNVSVLFLPRDNLVLSRIPSSGITYAGSTVTVYAQFYEDPVSGTPAVGVPLTIQVYAPDFTLLANYASVTNSTGTAAYTFPISSMAGDNTIDVSNSDLGGLLKATDFMGQGGTVNKITLSTTPSSPIYADGSTRYLLRMYALDSGGNPVANQVINVYKNGDQLYTYPVTTNAYGYAELDLGASTYVHTDLVTANTTNYINGNATYVTNSINVTYQAGSPSQIQVIANPNVVATRNVSTPNGMSDVHNTTVIATVLDQWGHPLSSQPVTISIANGNTTLGNITSPTGTTNNDGIYQSQFSLGYTINNTDMTVGVPINAVSGSLSSTCSIFYTSSSYLTLNSTITPRNNLSVNDTIDVKIKIQAIGWKTGTSLKGGNYSFELIFDSSGSMDWLSNTTYPANGNPDSGTMPAIQHSYSYYTPISSSDWHYVDTFNNPSTQTIQVMLSSDYRDYANGSYYYLKVVGPTGTYATDPAESTSNAQNSANENYVMITNAPAGAYKIYGAFVQGSVSGTQYNSMVLTQPKRLGSIADGMNTAARLAASQFINSRYGDRVGIIWFNDSYYGNGNHASGIAKSLTVVNNSTRPSFNQTMMNLKAYWGTNIGAGIQSAITDFNNNQKYVNGTKKIAIILTDGYSQYPDQDVVQAQQAAAQNITIYTIGMGMPDSATLSAIASATGGTYNRTFNTSGLFAAYQSISNSCSNNLTDVAATNATLMLVTNCSAAWGPDTRYIPYSAIVTYQNGTSAQVEPIVFDNGSYYSLSWNPGTFTLNDTWYVDYKLKVLRSGSIQPVTDQSYVSFVDTNNNVENETFPNQTLFVSVNGSMSNTTSPLGITLTYPPNGAIIDTTSSHTDWFVNYTVAGGNYYTYVQYRRVGDLTWNNMGVKGPYSSNATYSVVWNTGLLQNGNYQVQAQAYDGTYTNESDIHLVSINNQNGKIVLQ